MGEKTALGFGADPGQPKRSQRHNGEIDFDPVSIIGMIVTRP